MLRREAILRSACGIHFKSLIEAGKTAPGNFKCIERGTANIIVKDMYDGDIEKWEIIVNNMGADNPKIFDYMINNMSPFLRDYLSKR